MTSAAGDSLRIDDLTLRTAASVVVAAVSLAALIAARVPAVVSLVALVLLAAVLLPAWLRARRQGTITVVYQHNDPRLEIVTRRHRHLTKIDRSRWLFRWGVVFTGRNQHARRVRVLLYRPAVSRAALRRLRLWDLARGDR